MYDSVRLVFVDILIHNLNRYVILLMEKVRNICIWIQPWRLNRERKNTYTTKSPNVRENKSPNGALETSPMTTVVNFLKEGVWMMTFCWYDSVLLDVTNVKVFSCFLYQIQLFQDTFHGSLTPLNKSKVSIGQEML